jgi:hypothetical protein
LGVPDGVLLVAGPEAGINPVGDRGIGVAEYLADFFDGDTGLDHPYGSRVPQHVGGSL